MNQTKVIAWFKQVSTIEGLAVFALAGTGFFLHVFTAATACSILAAGAVLIGIPDNTGYLHRLANSNPISNQIMIAELKTPVTTTNTTNAKTS